MQLDAGAQALYANAFAEDHVHRGIQVCLLVCWQHHCTSVYRQTMNPKPRALNTSIDLLEQLLVRTSVAKPNLPLTFKGP